MKPDLRDAAMRWIADDPDPTTRAELQRVLADVLAGGPGDELAARMAGMLRFGTAGLRGPVRAGPAGMNVAVVRRATAGLAAWLARDGGRGTVVVGRDARHGSEAFAAAAAAVLGGAGFRVRTLPGPLPTPVLAFAVRELGAVAGVQITASHNPPADNGYKVYLADGAQLAPPSDTGIEAAITAAPAAVSVPVGGDVSTVDVTGSYLDRVARLPRGTARTLRVALTPMHGVGGATAVHALALAGFTDVHVVASQAAPDPEFPTVTFPNPEEPGATDALLALAAEVDADLAIALDPDADRCALGVPLPATAASTAGGQGNASTAGGQGNASTAGGQGNASTAGGQGTASTAGGQGNASTAGGQGNASTAGGRGNASTAGGRVSWRMLTGDETGVLLGDHLLRCGGYADPLVATTVVSSSMLRAVAAARGARFAETLTGFKWIVRGGPGLVFGYEEALGYCVDPDAVRDKDGIATATVACDLAATLAAAGQGLQDRLDELATAHGVHLTRGISVRMEPAPRDGAVERLRATPPAGWDVTRPAPDVLVLRRSGERLVIRPSGTEPKLKAYLEVVEPVGGDLPAARTRAGVRLDALGDEVQILIMGDDSSCDPR